MPMQTMRQLRVRRIPCYALYPHLSENMPSELVVFGGKAGEYKAKLTDDGKSIVMAMDWL